MLKNKLLIILIVVILLIFIAIIYINLKRTHKNENNNNIDINNERIDNVEGDIKMFNFETKTVKLNSGYEMPLNGIGTYSLTGYTCYNAIIFALNSGVD